MTVKDAKYEKHYQMIAESSKTGEKYVIKFRDDPVEYSGAPVLKPGADPSQTDRFHIKNLEPVEFQDSDPVFNIDRIEYMRKLM